MLEERKRLNAFFLCKLTIVLTRPCFFASRIGFAFSSATLFPPVRIMLFFAVPSRERLSVDVITPSGYSSSPKCLFGICPARPGSASTSVPPVPCRFPYCRGLSPAEAHGKTDLRLRAERICSGNPVKSVFILFFPQFFPAAGETH